MLGGRIAAIVSALLNTAHAYAQIPDLSGNWIRSGEIEFEESTFTNAGQRAFEDYDFRTDDPAYQCIGASWTRVWMNPNVLVGITQETDHVRLQYEWMDIDRHVPLIEPGELNPDRGSIEGMPALGRSAAWYDGNTLVIETVDFTEGYVTTMAQWAGMPQSPRMRTVERISRSEDLLTIETTHQDPLYYEEPLVVSIPYARSDWELMEYGCIPEEASRVGPD